jgi:hypothetical protein
MHINFDKKKLGGGPRISNNMSLPKDYEKLLLSIKRGEFDETQLRSIIKECDKALSSKPREDEKCRKEENLKALVEKHRRQIQIKEKKLRKSIRFVSMGVGSSGKVSETKTSEHRRLSCSTDLNEFEKYSDKFNYLLTSTHEVGDAQVSVSPTLTTMGTNMSIAIKLQRNFVVYFTGHGSKAADDTSDENGDWCFSQAKITFEQVSKLIHKTRKTCLFNNKESDIKVYVVCDCCYSGQWVLKWQKLSAAERSLFTVVSSCGPKQTCFDKTFASVFFDASVQPKEDLPVGCTKEALKSKLRDLLFSDTPHGYKHTCDIAKHDGTLERTVEFNKSDLCQKEFTVKLLRTIFKISLDKQWRASKEEKLRRFLGVNPMFGNHLITSKNIYSKVFFSDGAAEKEESWAV